MQRIRSVIVGTGFMGDVHARAVRASGGVVAAVVSRRRDAAEEAAVRFSADRASDSLDELLRADDVDLVHVCTPNGTHRDIAERVVAAGKHVICEKPLATNSSDARWLVDAASGVVAAVPFVYRFHNSVREARARLERGDAGGVRLIHGSYLQDWLSRADDTNWRVDPALGGASRAFADIGVHWCDLVEFVTGHRISRLVATLLALPRPGSEAGAGNEDAVAVSFVTDRGALGSLTVSQVSPGRKNRLWFSIDGADAAYEFDQETPDTLWVGGQNASTVVPRGAEGAIAPGVYNVVPAGHPQGYQDAFTAFVGDVHRAIRGESPDGLPVFADGLRAAVLTEAVLESAREGRWVDVPG